MCSGTKYRMREFFYTEDVYNFFYYGCSYWGWRRREGSIAVFLLPIKSFKNVTPDNTVLSCASFQMTSTQTINMQWCVPCVFHDC